MTDQERRKPSLKLKLWHYLPIVVILGLAGYLLYPQVANLTRSWYVVKNMVWWAVLVAAVMETISWVGNGVIFHYILKANGKHISIGKGSLIALGTLAISVVAGGGVGLAVSYGWLHRESKDSNSAFLAATLPSFFNTVTIVGVSIIGAAFLLIEHDLTTGQLIEFSLALFLLTALVAAALLAFRSESLIKKVGVWATKTWSKIRNKTYSVESTLQEIDKFFVAIKSMSHGKWLFALMGAIINIGFDMMAMFFLFIAAGNEISAGALFSGYGLPLVLARLAFVFPGGIGVVEGSMAGLFNSLGVPSSISVVVIMGYRLFSFWLPTILGFAAATYLSGKLFSHLVQQKEIESLDIKED